MIRYSLDPTVFGNPDYGHKVQTSREFTPKLGDVGRGRYTKYNPTAPLSVTATYHWDGPTLALFRADWEDRKKLNFGKNWFGITLPFYFSRLAPGEYPAQFARPFRASYAGHNYWSVNMTLDIDPSPQLVLS